MNEELIGYGGAVVILGGMGLAALSLIGFTAWSFA